MALDSDVLAAVRRYGPSINDYSERTYGISGTALLAKLVQGESGGRGNAVSPAGARGWAQFMPGSRQTAISKYGVDPWADPDQAVHAAVLHLQGKINGSKGLAGYNPGDPSYTNYILGQRVGNVLGGSPSSSPSTTQGAAGVPAVGPAASGSIGSGSAGDVSGLLSSLLGSRERQAPAPMPLQAPSFAASPVMPGGFAPLAQVAAPAPAQESLVSQQLGLLDALRGDDPTSGASDALGGAGGVSIAQSVQQQNTPIASSGGSGTGKITVAAGANREGVGLSSQILRFARRVAGVYGSPLTIGTGSNHSQYTVNGNVSNHWDGNAADIPAAGASLIAEGQAALIAAGMPRAKAVKQKGGLFNVGPYQIIFNTQQGGDHTDHLHIGYRG